MRRTKGLYRTRGVTLMEMLVVVAIIGILAGIGVPSFIGILKNHRTRSSALALLSAIRRTRSRAISLNRQLSMEIYGDSASAAKQRTYTVKRSAYVLYDPKSVAEGTLEKLFEENAETLEEDVSFEVNKGLEKGVSTNPSSTPLSITFNPSGTVLISGSTYAKITLQGAFLTYEIYIYKGGQVNMSRAT